MEDEEGVFHFTDTPPKNDKRFKPMTKNNPLYNELSRTNPEPKDIIFKQVLPDGTVWAAKATGKKNFYFWYFDEEDRRLFKVVDPNHAEAIGYQVTFKNGEVLFFSTRKGPRTWLPGQPGYEMVMSTFRHANQ